MSPRPPRILCATMHAERLQEDRVWEQVQSLLTRWGRHGRHWTLFVQPLRARVVGMDLRPRLDWLRDNGHEVAMHTHFYRMLSPPGTRPEFAKEADLRTPSVLRCLDEDYAYLVDIGHRPVGFVAGAWVMHEAVPEWLVNHGFVYDSSRRTYRLSYVNAAAAAGDNHTAVEHVDGVAHVPTTASVTALAAARARGARREIRLGDHRSYEMFYLHDYDLDRLRARVAVRMVERLAWADSFQSVSELACTVTPN